MTYASSSFARLKVVSPALPTDNLVLKFALSGEALLQDLVQVLVVTDLVTQRTHKHGHLERSREL